jgi:hypothetical protein
LGCGFTPMYSVNKKVSFYIESINFNNSDKELAGFIKSNLSNYLIKNNGKKFKINASINYSKNSISKDVSGNTEEYELTSTLNLLISQGELNRSVLIKEVSRMKNFTDEFEELQYERSAKESMARSITSRLLMQLSVINAN